MAVVLITQHQALAISVAVLALVGIILAVVYIKARWF